MKGVFGLLLIIGGALLAWLVITGKVHLGGTTGTSSGVTPPGPEKAPSNTEANAGTAITTPGSTTGGQQP